MLALTLPAVDLALGLAPQSVLQLAFLGSIKGPVFLVLYVLGMVLLPLVMPRQAAGVVLLAVGGLKLMIGINHHKPVCFLMMLLGVTVLTHLAPHDSRGGGSGSSCSGGGFFFFGSGGCGSSCGSGCGSSCGGGCGGGCGGCG